jgi:hypothetical protein
MAIRRSNMYLQNCRDMERLASESIPDAKLGAIWESAMVMLDSEPELVGLIRKHLLTEDQRQRIFDADFSIEDALNGRIADAGKQAICDAIYQEWNAKLGYRSFGG